MKGEREGGTFNEGHMMLIFFDTVAYNTSYQYNNIVYILYV